jgi:hypothetical protein
MFKHQHTNEKFVGCTLDKEQNPKATPGLVGSCNKLQVQIHILGTFVYNAHMNYRYEFAKNLWQRWIDVNKYSYEHYVCEYIVHGCVSQHLLAFETNSYSYYKKLTHYN